MSLKLNTPFPIFAPSLIPSQTPTLNPYPNQNPQRGPNEIRFSRWGNTNAERFEERRRTQEELESEIRRNRRFDGVTKIIHTHDSESAASEPQMAKFRSRGSPSLPSAQSIPGRRSKYSKPYLGPDKPKNKPKVPDSPPQLDSKPEVKLSNDGLTYVINGAPFEFKYSYTETPKVKPLKLREPPYAPFGPTTMGRPWTGRAPFPPSKKTPREFDSFNLPPTGMKGVKPVQNPGPFRPGLGPRYVKTKEEILGEPLTKEEIRELVTSCLKTTRQLNMGRDGLTHNMLNNIHDLWKRRRVCKIKCKGVCTVDMDNVCEQLEDKIGGKVIYRRGGVLFLFRGRNYNHRTRPRFPLMLWKPVTPVYPKLIKQVPEGLTHQEANELRRKGRELMPICKLGKNGVYCDLVKNVKEAFEVCELVRINCQRMKASDFRRIGAKLKDLVPCVLISFENEHILMWRGKDWKSSLELIPDKDDILKDIEIDTTLQENDEDSSQNSLSDSIELGNDADFDDQITSKEANPVTYGHSVSATELNNSNGDHKEPEKDSEASEEMNKVMNQRESIERVLSLMKEAVENGIALVLDGSDDLDADEVFAKALAFSKKAPKGPVFENDLKKAPKGPVFENDLKKAPPLMGKKEENGVAESVVVVKEEVVEKVEKVVKKKEMVKKMNEFEDDYRQVIPHGTLKVDELAKLLS